MKDIRVTRQGCTVELTTTAVGHSLLCHLTPIEITTILAAALQQVLTLAEETDPRGHPE